MDFVDAYILCNDLNVTTRESLLEIVSEYISLTLIGERQSNFIQYLGRYFPRTCEINGYNGRTYDGS